MSRMDVCGPTIVSTLRLLHTKVYTLILSQSLDKIQQKYKGEETIQYSTIQYNTVQYSTIQYITVQ